MRKLLFTNSLSLGDIVMLTAAVRDLHRTLPGVFATDARTTFADLWQNNPHLTPLDEYDPEVKVLHCAYPLIQASNQGPYHCLHGFIDFLNRSLGTRIRPTEFKGDLHLSRSEQHARSLVHQVTGEDIPFWIIAAGGKHDYTIKWWDHARYQEVVDHFHGRIQFVQVGAAEHHHPRLDGVIDLRGRTSVRQMIQLAYHAQGVLCGVTSWMHLAAAVPLPGRLNRIRPCVVVAGGREPAHWEAYPGHQFIHTIGALPCCRAGGCWKARTLPLGDGEPMDAPEHLCTNVRGTLPRCMDLITAAEVARRIEGYFTGGALKFLNAAQARRARHAVVAAGPTVVNDRTLTLYNARELSDQFIRTIPSCPDHFAGRGIVICAGGPQLFTNAWVCINMLRRLGCTLPIQLWHLHEHEVDTEMRMLVAPLGVECVNAAEFQKTGAPRVVDGWVLKSFAIHHTRFAEILLLDADNVPVVNPEFLFATPQYRRTGAIFWPDYNCLGPERAIWKVCGVPYRHEPEFETGQIVVNKKKCWAALALALWYNERASFYYQHIYGDKDTFHFAFRKLGRPYAMPKTPIHTLRGAMCQHDFDGNRIFQHRNTDKWNLFLHNKRSRGFLFEKECRHYVQQLRAGWDGRSSRYQSATASRSSGALEQLPSSTARLGISLISGPGREAVRTRTLRRLARTDWGGAPVAVCLDPERFLNRLDSYTHATWLALRESLQTDAEFTLFLGDDLTFNRHLRHNLQAWTLVRERSLTLGSVYNPGVTDLACDVANNLIVVDPAGTHRSQAFLISRATVQHILKNWKETAASFEVRGPRLAAQLGAPICYHAPSLVQHLGGKSVWGGAKHHAADYHATWRAPAPDVSRWTQASRREALVTD